MHYLSVPEKLKEKRASFDTHRELMKEQSHELNQVKAQPYVYSRCRFSAHVMTSDHTNADDIKSHTQQHLNEFHIVDKLMKKVTNDENEIPR